MEDKKKIKGLIEMCTGEKRKTLIDTLIKELKKDIKDLNEDHMGLSKNYILHENELEKYKAVVEKIKGYIKWGIPEEQSEDYAMKCHQLEAIHEAISKLDKGGK